MVDSLTKEAKTKDFIAFERALSQLHGNLLRDYVNDGHSIVIAMSRKGPKLVDAVFKKDELNRLNVVTEFAIPFLFGKMERGITYHIYIIDDAIYYGSTLKNLIKEIKEYEQLYGLKLVVKAYVAIIDKEALFFSEVEVIGTVGPRNGYGHYFVQQVMSLFRIRKRCMEVEYPAITYTLDKASDLNALEEDFRRINGRSYMISYKEEDVLTVLFEKNASQFSKVRIFRDGAKLQMTFMSPFNLSTGTVFSDELLASMGTAYKRWWMSLLNCVADKDKKQVLSDTTRRNVEKSLVVIANYIYSFQEFIYHRQGIENILKSRGYNILSHDFNSSDIYRLIGNRTLSDELSRIFVRFDQLIDFKFPEWHSSTISVQHQIYEEFDSPSVDERRTLEAHNEHMIRNSRTYQEALSAIIFNQNLFVERWSRHGLQAPNRHLWFGYSHDVLIYQIKRYSRLHEEPSEILIHEWLDKRVDMGCVVPQYIIDNSSSQWVRVFRPGENEEIVLSHLARYVLFVYQLIDQRLKLGFVPIDVLDQMLVVLHKQLWNDILSKQFFFEVNVQQRRLYIAEQKNGENSTPILRYLRKMYVLEENNEEVTIAPRISDPEFLSNTTLDDKSVSLVGQIVDVIMARYQEMDVKYSTSESFFNYYLHHDVKPEFLLDYSKDIARQLYEVAKDINVAMHYEKEKIADEKIEDKLIGCFNDIMEYDLSPEFYLEGIKDDKEYMERCERDLNLKAQNNFKTLLQIINLMIGVYVLDNFGNVLNYLKSESTLKTMTMLRLGALRKYIEGLNELNPSKIRKDPQLLNIIKNILERIIND